VLNLEYPLPYKWNLMINMFEKRKQKYISAVKIFRKLKNKWYKPKKLERLNSKRHSVSPRKILEKVENVKTFKSLISEIKDNHAPPISLRKIDAKKRLSLEEEKKSPVDMQLDMLENEQPQTTTNNYESIIEEMKYNADGQSIIGKMPVFEITYDKFGGSVETRIARIDGDQSKNPASLYNKNKEIIPSKGMFEISQDILNQAYIPQPHMTEDMKRWEEDFNNDFYKRKRKNVEFSLSPSSKRSRHNK